MPILHENACFSVEAEDDETCDRHQLLTTMNLMTWALFLLAIALSLAQHLPRCPELHRQRLLEYKAFHNAQKASADAKYLIHVCADVTENAGETGRMLSSS